MGTPTLGSKDSLKTTIYTLGSSHRHKSDKTETADAIYETTEENTTEFGHTQSQRP